MARVTPDELKEIIDTSLGDTVLYAFINAANLMVTRHLGSSAYVSDDERKEIERWLAAHLLAAREKQAQREEVDRAAITYQGDFGMGLDSTSYGQAVMSMDPTGTLAAAVGKRKASVYAVTSFSD